MALLYLLAGGHPEAVTMHELRVGEVVSLLEISRAWLVDPVQPARKARARSSSATASWKP